MTANTLFVDVLQILQTARQKTYILINSEMVQAYWLMGKRIVEEEQLGEQKASYGEAILKTLSVSLTAELGKGFSYANLCNFRQFYLTYPDSSILYALRSTLSWTHHRMIMRVENPNAREYYLKECAEQMWSTRTLERNLNTFYYERLLSSKDKQAALEDSKTLERTNPDEFIKDPYVFEFLNISEPITANEQEVESALIQNLQQFLLELGKGFSFVGRQFRISTETSHFYIDLVFL